MIEEAIGSLKEALSKIERSWIMNPDGDYKHIRRDIIDALNSLDHNHVSYIFDPINPPTEHDEFRKFQGLI